MAMETEVSRRASALSIDSNGLWNEEIKYDIWSISELNRRSKTEGLSLQQVTRILKTTTILEHNNRNLEYEQARLEFSNKQAAETFQQFTDLVQKDRKSIEENEYIIIQQKREIENLSIEKARLENIIDSIQLKNETYVRIKQTVKQEIENHILKPRQLIKCALASLFESSRKHPGKFQTVYYNMPSHLSVEQILSDSSRSQEPSLYGFSENEIEKVLLDEAEQSYNRLVNAVTNNCINKMPSDTKSSSQVLPLPIIQDGRSNHEILDTGNLSEVNFVYNDITFQIYPGCELTNERNSETTPRSKENGLDPYNFSQDI